MNFCIKYLSVCLILTRYILVSCREISRSSSSSSSPTACYCPSSDSCSEDETLLLALGAILGYILTQMTPSMQTLSLLFPIGLPTVGRTNIHFATKQEPEAMAKGLILGIQSFSDVIKRPICGEKYLCLANQRWKKTHKFDSVLQILGSVAGQITIKNVIEISESTLNFLAFKNSTDCNGKKYPFCFATVFIEQLAK